MSFALLSCDTILGIDGDYGDLSADAGDRAGPADDDGDDTDAPVGPLSAGGSPQGMSPEDDGDGSGGEEPSGGNGPNPADDDIPEPPPVDDDDPVDPAPNPTGPTASGGEAGSGGQPTQPATGGAAGLGSFGGSGNSTSEAGAGGDTSAPPVEISLRGVQSGTTSVSSGNASASVAIQAVDPERSFLVFGSAFDSTSASNSELTGQITSSSQLVFARNSSSASAGTVPVHYYVAEFESGVRVQRGSRVLEEATEVVALDAIDRSKSVPLISFRNTGSVYGLDDFVRAELTGPSELSLSMYQAFGEGVVEWQVVTFEDATTSVQSGNVSFASDQTVLRTPLGQSVDPQRTWLVLSYQVADISELAHEVMVRGIVDSSTEVVFERSGTGATIELTYYAVSFADGVGVQSGTRAIGEAELSVATTITPVDPARSIGLAAGCYQRSGATPYSLASNPGYATFLFDLSAGNSINATRVASGDGSATFAWYVIEFPE